MDYCYESLELYIMPLRSDNYSYVIHDRRANKTLVVDPSETEPLIRFLKENSFGLDLIIDTHHHDDHTQGNQGLQKEFSAEIAASSYDLDQGRISGRATKALKEGDRLGFSNYSFRVISTPGHTLGHVCLFLEGAEWLFSGDTLFALGCGRLFEGNPEIMWRSFLKLRALPDSTLVFCGHEYTLSNARFALAIGEKVPGLPQYVKRIEERKEKEGRTIPSRLGDEKTFNPFFLADSPLFHRLAQGSVAVFAEIRRQKDHFK